MNASLVLSRLQSEMSANTHFSDLLQQLEDIGRKCSDDGKSCKELLDEGLLGALCSLMSHRDVAVRLATG